ncbi:MAG: hypothetical protein JWN46_854, partial [Acidimicrobiales bacterium]|nr:hypothetical protein [Acidimicrobiales bacterium]
MNALMPPEAPPRAGDADDAMFAALIALATLPGMGPARLLALHRGPGATAAWTAVAEGTAHHLQVLHGRLGRDAPGQSRRWAQAAARIDPPR